MKAGSARTRAEPAGWHLDLGAQDLSRRVGRTPVQNARVAGNDRQAHARWPGMGALEEGRDHGERRPRLVELGVPLAVQSGSQDAAPLLRSLVVIGGTVLVSMVSDNEGKPCGTHTASRRSASALRHGEELLWQPLTSMAQNSCLSWTRADVGAERVTGRSTGPERKGDLRAYFKGWDG